MTTSIIASRAVVSGELLHGVEIQIQSGDSHLDIVLTPAIARTVAHDILRDADIVELAGGASPAVVQLSMRVDRPGGS
jgi:hypothetical protein